MMPTGKADDGGGQNAGRGDQQGIEEADHDGAAVGRCLGIGNERERQAEARRGVEEPEARGDVARPQILNGVVDDGPAEPEDGDQQGRLEDESADLGVVEKGDALAILALLPSCHD
jgi:hypothetical protein